MKAIAVGLKLGGSLTAFIGFLGGILGSFGYVVKIGGAVFPYINWMNGVVIIICGGLSYVIGFFLQKVSKPVQTQKPVLDINNLEFIIRALRKTRNRIMGIAIFLLLFTAIIIIVESVIDDKSGNVGGDVVINIILTLCGLGGVALFIKAYGNWKVRETKAYKVIMLEPQTITHLKVLVAQSGIAKGTNVGKFISANIFVGRKHLTMLSVSETDIELLKQYLERANPNLTYERTSQS